MQTEGELQTPRQASQPDRPSALEETINKHSASSTAAFSGRGQTLGGGSAPVDVKFEVSSRIMSASNGVSGLDPQVKILLALVIAYAFFWYLS